MKLLWKKEESMEYTEEQLDLYSFPHLMNNNFFYISANLEKEYVHLKIASKEKITIEKSPTYDTQKPTTHISFYYTKWKLDGVLYEEKSAQGKITKPVKIPFNVN